MKVLCVAPFYVCVELVVGGAALVFLVQEFFGVIAGDFVDFRDALYPSDAFPVLFVWNVFLPKSFVA